MVYHLTHATPNVARPFKAECRLPSRHLWKNARKNVVMAGGGTLSDNIR